MPAATAARMPPALSSITRHAGLHSEPVGGKQEDVGTWLAARHHVGAEDVAAELIGEVEHLETEFQAVDRTGGRDASRQVGKCLDEFSGAAHFPEVAPKPVQRGGLEIVGETGGYGLPTADSICVMTSFHRLPA